MQASLKFLAVTTLSAFAGLAPVAAQAETYDGVQTHTSALSRAEVDAEAVRAASAPNQNVVRGSRGAESFTAVADPKAVAQEAMRAAAAPDQNVSSGSRVNSKVISTMPHPMDVRTSNASSGSRL
jgi:nicotinic acid phosphoribosyltransferase